MTVPPRIAGRSVSRETVRALYDTAVFGAGLLLGAAIVLVVWWAQQ